MAIGRDLEEQHLRRQKMRDIKRNRDGRTFSRRILIWTARAFLFLLLAGMGITLCSFVSSSKMLELKEVEVLGGSRADVGEIQRVLRQEFHRNLYGIRLEKVQGFLESQAWVRSAQVRRVFPNRLKILLAERRPVALAKIESELFLVDRYGVVLEPYGPKFLHLDLPVVRGLENSTQENVSANNRIKMDTVMEVLTEFDSGVQRLSDKISEIDVSDPGRVAVVPQDHAIKVFLGDSDYRERFQTYLSKLSLMADLTAKYGAMDSVDLSIKHKIIFHAKSGAGSSINMKAEQPG